MSKDLLNFLLEGKYLEYGSIFPVKIIHDFLGIEVPDIGTKSDFDAIALKELEAIGYVRNYLISNGKYIKQEKDHYRVLLPSENINKVYGYMQEAKRKNAKAQKLLYSTPLKATANENDTLKARLLMQADDIKKSQKRKK